VSGKEIRFLAVGESTGLSRSPASLLRSLKGLARLWLALRVHDQILQVHRPYRPLVLNRHRAPIVQFIHLDLRDWPGPDGWPKLRSLYRQFSDTTLEKMDRVFVVNEPGAVILRDEHPAVADRVEFLPVWYDEDVFHPATQPSREFLRAKLADELPLHAGAGTGEAATDQRFILVAARLTDIKKPLLAIETIAELARRGTTNAQLIVAGSGELLDDARACAAVLGVADRVHFVGDRPREQIAELMQASDALLLTARSEGGGPRVVVEALASGLPVVSTMVVEIRRTVTHRENGWLVDEATPALLADGLEWVLAQPHGQVAAKATPAAAPFTAERILAGLYETYRSLAPSHTAE